MNSECKTVCVEGCLWFTYLWQFLSENKQGKGKEKTLNVLWAVVLSKLKVFIPSFWERQDPIYFLLLNILLNRNSDILLLRKRTFLPIRTLDNKCHAYTFSTLNSVHCFFFFLIWRQFMVNIFMKPKTLVSICCSLQTHSPSTTGCLRMAIHNLSQSVFLKYLEEWCCVAGEYLEDFYLQRFSIETCLSTKELQCFIVPWCRLFTQACKQKVQEGE